MPYLSWLTFITFYPFISNVLLRSLVSSLCPVIQLTILTCLYWSHPTLEYWMCLLDQPLSVFPLSFLSLFSLLSIISVCYLPECKHQGLWFRNDSAGSRGQRAACKASTGITKCTWQPIINVATKRGGVTMQSNRTQIHISYSAHYQEGF